jgi:CheY-like chemotaxis protein
MKVFILEDAPDRIKWLKKLFVGHEITLKETSISAIEELGTAESFDMILLDHDLGGEIFVESGENTGYAVAQYLVRDEVLQKYRKAFVFIHSCNPIGAAKMQEILKNKYRTLVFPVSYMFSTFNEAL